MSNIKRKRSSTTAFWISAGVLLAIVGALLVTQVRGDRSSGAATANLHGNEIHVIRPYKRHGTWVFDDERVGLAAEPFVAGVPELIDQLVADIPDAAEGFRLTFSRAAFPGHEIILERDVPYRDGCYYRDPRSGRRGWLCPAMFRYFESAPPRIYASAERIGGP